ncbi:MAG: dGTP triphosphohydrolase [Spirochaetia bacterium]
MYTATDWDREKAIPPKAGLQDEDYREPWRRDYARVLHSPAFRRLQGKTQLFPNNESDFFRNRLTHSLEVAQIAKSIAIKLNHTEPPLLERGLKIKYDVCELAALAHDMGHPPFGHVGEKALNERMCNCGGFEGNAQTLRILAKLEKRDKAADSDEVGFSSDGSDCRFGLNLTYRSLASILKYPQMIPHDQHGDTVRKGFYDTELDLVSRLLEHVAPGTKEQDFRTIECSIMDLADNIAYSTYALEDALKANFTSPLDIISLDPYLLEQIRQELDDELNVQEIKDVLYWVFSKGLEEENGDQELPHIALLSTASVFSKRIVNDGYARADLTSYLVGRFIQAAHLDTTQPNPALWRVTLDPETDRTVDVLKKFSYVVLINSSLIKIVEMRGKEIVSKIFRAIKRSTSSRNNLLPPDFRRVYDRVEECDKNRVICDFIAGMTDRYALEFYGRLYSENPQTIFKPL